MLVGQIADEFHRSHLDRRRGQAAPHQAGIGRVGRHRRHARRTRVIEERHLGHTVAQQLAADVGELFDRRAQRRMPERDEVRFHLGHHRAGHEHVAIAEVEAVVPVEIVVLVIAPAGDADHAVDHQRLAVHALVEPAPAAGRRHHVARIADARAAEHRVVDAQLEIGVAAGQGGQGLDGAHRRELVDQQAHLHAATRGGQQFFQHEVAGIVLVEDVGLQIDRALRAADQVQPRQQCVLAVFEQQRVVPRRLRRAARDGVHAELPQRRWRGAGIGALADDLGRACGHGDVRGRVALGRRQRGARGRGQRGGQQQQSQRTPHHSVSRVRIRRVKRTWSDRA